MVIVKAFLLLAIALLGSSCSKLMDVDVNVQKVNSISLLPQLSYELSSGKIIILGQSLNVTPSTLEGEGITCSISPSLPTGVLLDSSTCTISGTPGSVFSNSYLVKATNIHGEVEASIAIAAEIRSPGISFLLSAGTIGYFQTPMSVTPSTLNDNGSAISSCTINKALPAGLSIDSITCVISGTPTETSAYDTYIVTVTNSMGSTSASVGLSVSAINPIISYDGATGTSGAVAGSSMTVSPTTLISNGAPVTCSIDATSEHSLPTGLSLNTSSCVISGSVSSSVSAGTFNIKVRATNTAGSNTSVVSLTISASAPTISYAGATGTSGAVAGSSMTVSPTTLISNGAPVTCSIDATSEHSLPTGLSLNSSSCVISGSVSSSVTPGTFNIKVRATNTAGSSTSIVSLTISAGAPTISYAGASGTSGAVAGSSMSVSPTTLSSNGAAVTCSIDATSEHSLPAGLSLNSTSCVISGSVSSSVSAGTYNIKVQATNTAGSASSIVSLTISASAPTISYAGATGTSGYVQTSMSVAPTTLNNNGSAINNCTVNKALPAGLSINTVTCVISGTPTEITASDTYTVTATNSAGSSTANITLEVSVSAPTISYAGANGTSGAVAGSSMSVSPTTLSSNGAAVTCSIDATSEHSLPTGLSLNSTSCVISGSVSSSVTPGTFNIKVQATNTAGSNASIVSLTISASAPTISYAGATGTSGYVGNTMTVTPSTLNNNGATITNCTTSDTLPAGLTLNSTTCVISGTPTATSASTSYTISAVNSIGTTSASVTLAVIQFCPTGYIRVPYNTAVGTSSDFCVAKYEMRVVSGNAVSQCCGIPANGYSSPVIPKSLCQAIGTNYDLISNAEWMTLARNIELQDNNWFNGTAQGTAGNSAHKLATGHSDNSPSSILAPSTDNDAYIGTGDSSSSNPTQRRTHSLSNGEVIWDLAGNVWEWIDWSVNPSKKAYDVANGGSVSLPKEWRLINRLIGQSGTDEMKPETWASNYINFSADEPDVTTSLTSANGLGIYYAGPSTTGSNSGLAIRGGHYNPNPGGSVGHGTPGIFTLSLMPNSIPTSDSVKGFRCVYRPPQ